MSDDDLSDLSSILSSVPSDDESDLLLQKKDGILKFFSKIDSKKPAPTRKASTPPPEREPSPEHVYVLADNPDIAVRLSSHCRVAGTLMRRISRPILVYRSVTNISYIVHRYVPFTI